MPEINSYDPVPDGEVIPEVGQIGTEEIAEIRNRILGPPATGWLWRSRLAPSIITRGEAELLGLNMPRFAVRVYLDDECTTFVNARRIPVLAKHARLEKHDTANDLISDLENSSCIADSLLPTAQFRPTYHIIEADGGAVYGERQSVRGLPYVKHMDLGGGLCAQATCFSATVMLHQHARVIYGVAEVTVVATKPKEGHLPLEGLTRKQIGQYLLKTAGLRSAEQHLPHLPDNAEPAPTWLARALSSYAISDMPVIFPLSMQGMRQYIWRDNNIDPDDWDITGHGEHVILVVGSGRDPDRQQFLVSDTSLYPLMRATADGLLSAQQYASEGEPSVPIPVFLSVTPLDVRLPVWNVAGTNNRNSWGLVALSVLAHGLLPKFHPDLFPRVPLATYPKFTRLLSRAEIWPFLKTTVGVQPDAFNKKPEVWFRARARDGYEPWYWVQYVKHPSSKGSPCASAWIWDATRDPVEDPGESANQADNRRLCNRIRSEYLLCVLQQSRGKWQRTHPRARR